ncbi:3869_t:CDS:10 [Funneliformis geosporum]|uniref:3249_t:CDS:1 n=1 Tax=Funneliformis geosporum TaxID=1117311 RepID=A0A9W4SZG0_9GLOM|nr:3869_t:CDS:10 [Funneliformis geosporum]CAI2186999.1 3249_t:CDS:10 [Funneliformis geosporum]
MPRRRKDKEFDDGLDSSSESEKELSEISDTLLLEERELFENPSRKRRKFTKEDAYLGIWAEPDEADRSIRPNRKKRDVQFVSSASRPVTVEDDETVDYAYTDHSSGEDVEAKKNNAKNVTNISDSIADNSNTVMEENIEGYVGLGLNSSLNIQFSSTKGKGSQKSNDSSKKRVDKNFGSFEKHTKGIGLKLMMKYGYKIGEGLGSERSGIVNPIETQLRPARMGLAYQGFKEKNKQTKEAEKRQVNGLVEDEEEISIKSVKKEKSNAWKKSAKTKKPKIAYKTADEIINEIGLSSSIQPIKIIDMTGPQVRELSSTSQISSLAIPDTSTRLPELRHNLRLIVDISKADLEHFTRERRIQTERTKVLKKDKIIATEQVDDEKRKISRLGEIISIIKECSMRLTLSLSNGSLSLKDFYAPFDKIQSEYVNEFTTYNLDAAIIAIITPVIKQNMIDWNPLKSPDFCVLDFLKWKDLFRTSPPITNAPLLDDDRFNYNSSSQRPSEITMTPYESMMYNVWLPKIRSEINNNWNARDCDAPITLLECWKPPLLPMFIYDNIIDQLIMPKLTREVDAWNPNTDTQMIHQWLHPWLPILGERMEPLYLTIRQKFRSSLQRWDPIDTSAFDIIEPWKNVFKPEDMQSLLVKAILPKLTDTMKTKLQINPKKQELEAFNSIMTWRDLFTPKAFNQLFEDTFFPKWLNVLYIWLTHNPNYGEIRQWYLFWKLLFPKEMFDSPIIEEQFMRALYMIEESISLGRDAPIRLTHPSQQNTIPEPEQFRFPSEKTVTDIVDITFFEIVEEFAQEKNFLFLPTNKIHDSGKPLFRMGCTSEGIGGLLMYLSDDVMYVKEGQNWTPMGFGEVFGKLEILNRRL